MFQPQSFGVTGTRPKATEGSTLHKHVFQLNTNKIHYFISVAYFSVYNQKIPSSESLEETITFVTQKIEHFWNSPIA